MHRKSNHSYGNKPVVTHISDQKWRQAGENRSHHKRKRRHQRKSRHQRIKSHAHTRMDSRISTETVIMTTLILFTALAGMMLVSQRGQAKSPGNQLMVFNSTNNFCMKTFRHHYNVTTSHHRTIEPNHNESLRAHYTSSPNQKSASEKDQSAHSARKMKLSNENTSVVVKSTIETSSTTHDTHQNVDLHYPLSACNYDDINQNKCKVKKLTRYNIGKAKILDFWGEGRIVDDDLITGFTDSYNVNQQEQKISNGKNYDEMIPNRIPTIDYKNVRLDKLIADHTFQFVTVMGAPIIPESAQEMYRIVRKDNSARIAFYGMESDAAITLQNASQNDFIYMQHSNQYVDELDPQLKEPTIRPIILMVPIKLVMKDLQEAIQKNDVNTSVRILLDLARYIRSGYSRSEQIRVHVGHILHAYENKSQLIQALEQIASIEQVTAVMGQFDIEPNKSDILDNVLCCKIR